MAEAATPWPSEIRLVRDRSALRLSFADATGAELSAEYLRVKSPSAEVRGHGAGDEVTVAGKRDVKISSLEEVGNYALRIIFDDGHSTGIYSWSYLARLAREHATIWAGYLAALEREGLSRER
jgi:DUF971 family protein